MDMVEALTGFRDWLKEDSKDRPKGLSLIHDILKPAGRGIYDLANMSGQAAQGQYIEPTAITKPLMDAGIGQGALAMTKGALMREAYDPNTLRMFAGTSAKTVNPDALALAKRMEAEGATRDEIWRATGEQYGQPWYNDAKGGGWKFEIDDSGADFKKYINEIPLRKGPELQSFAKHPDIYAAYPDMAKIRMGLNYDVGNRGAHYAAQNKIELGGAHMKDGARGKRWGGEDVNSTLLHESQHGIQSREGFARGGSAGEYTSGPMFDAKANALKDDLSRAITGGISSRPQEILETVKYLDPTELQAIAESHGFKTPSEALEFLKYQDERRTPFGQYRRLAGEAEARNVQTRMDYPMQQRIEQPPWTTLDVPEDELIYRFKDMTQALGGK